MEDTIKNIKQFLIYIKSMPDANEYILLCTNFNLGFIVFLLLENGNLDLKIENDYAFIMPLDYDNLKTSYDKLIESKDTEANIINSLGIPINKQLHCNILCMECLNDSPFKEMTFFTSLLGAKFLPDKLDI